MKNPDAVQKQIKISMAICTACVLLLSVGIYWIDRQEPLFPAASGQMFGWIMATAVGLLNAPQVIKTFRERSVNALSRLTIGLHLINNCSGLLYGLSIASYPLMVCNVFYFASNILLVSAFVIFSPHQSGSFHGTSLDRL